MFRCDSSRIKEFVGFSRAQLRSGDWDPAYPVLRHLIREEELSENDALNLILLYVAYYNLASALTTFRHMQKDDFVWMSKELQLPTGVERRGNRGLAQIIAHIESLGEYSENWQQTKRWLGFDWKEAGRDSYACPNPQAMWKEVRNRYERAWNAGRWASYKLAELLQKVMDYPIVPPDMGNKDSTAPRKGLALLYGELEGNDQDTIDRLDEQGDHLLNFLRTELEGDAKGLVQRFPGRVEYGLDIAMVETLCCDFHSYHKGKYYTGHDLNQMWEQITHPRVPRDVTVSLLSARNCGVFPEEFLCEKGSNGLPICE